LNITGISRDPRHRVSAGSRHDAFLRAFFQTEGTAEFGRISVAVHFTEMAAPVRLVYRRELETAARGQGNFSGRYIVTENGCGASCLLAGTALILRQRPEFDVAATDADSMVYDDFLCGACARLARYSVFQEAELEVSMVIKESNMKHKPAGKLSPDAMTSGPHGTAPPARKSRAAPARIVKAPPKPGTVSRELVFSAVSNAIAYKSK
jgi:hypothetical protein